MKALTTITAPSARNTLLFFAALLGLLIVYWFPWLSESKDFYQQDLTYHFEPLCRYIGESLRHGRIPLWNPDLFCGMSQIAVPSPNALYPLNWLFAMFPFSVAVSLNLICHQMIAASGMYLLLRQLGTGRFAAATSAVIAALNGYMFTLVANFTLGSAVSWVPLLVFFVLRIDGRVTRQAILHCASVSLTTAMMLLAGRAEIGVGAFALIGALMLIQLLSTINRTSAMQFIMRAAAILLGVFLAAPLLIPLLEWFQHSPRKAGMRAGFTLWWSGNWYDWLATVLMQPAGNRMDMNNYLAQMVASRDNSLTYLPSAYIGPIAVTLALFGLGDKTVRYRFWLLGALLLFVLLVCGGFTPVGAWFVTHIPFATIFRYPIKFIIFPVLIVAVLAGLGLQSVTHDRPQKITVIAVALLWSAVFAAGLWATRTDSIAHFVEQIPIPSSAPNPLKLQADLQFALGRRMIEAAFFASGLVILLVVNAFFRNRIYLSPQILGAVVVIGLSGGLALSAWQDPVGAIPSGFYNTTSTLAAELHRLSKSNDKADRILTIYPQPLLPKSPNQPDYVYYQYSRAMLNGDCSLDYSIPTAQGYEASSTGTYLQALDSVVSRAIPRPGSKPWVMPLAKFAYLSGVRYVVTQSMLGYWPQQVAEKYDPKLFTRVATNPNDMWTIYEPNLGRDRIEIATNIRYDTSFNPLVESVFDFSTSVTTKPTTIRLRGNEQKPAVSIEALAPTDRATITRDETEFVSLDCNLSAPRIIVLSDTFYPGWHAYVDGKETRILQCNAFFRAVEVPAGSHRVNFAFRPLGYAMGIFLALLAALAYLCLWWRLKKRPGS